MPLRNRKEGILAVSVPKSGTMFFARSTEALTGCVPVFGFSADLRKDLPEYLSRHCHPDIRREESSSSPGPEIMVRRYRLLLRKNREILRKGGRVLLFDHGFDDFLIFLKCPHLVRILPPREVLNMARQERLKVVFIYRDIPSIAQSFVHFLVSGKSYLMRLRSLEGAARIVTEHYMPRILELIQTWLEMRAHEDVLVLDYDTIVKDLGGTMARVCAHAGLAGCRTEGVSAADFRSWTYRKKTERRPSPFTAEQERHLKAMQDALALEVRS